MKKIETVIVDDDRGQGMNFLLFLCFFFYMSVKLLAGKGSPELTGGIARALYAVFVPGFVFRLGYCYGGKRDESREDRRRWVRNMGIRYYIYFFLLSFVYESCKALMYQDWIGFYKKKFVVMGMFSDVLALIRAPGISAVFLTMAVLLLLVFVFDEKLCRIGENNRKMAAAGVLCLLCCLLRVKGNAYIPVAVLFGATKQDVIASVPYASFFFLGMWYAGKKNGFRWQALVVPAAVTAASLVLQHVGLKVLFRITVSLFPVCALYYVSGAVTDLTRRFRALRLACGSVEPVFGVYSLLMIALYASKACSDSGWVSLLIGAAGIALIYGTAAAFGAFTGAYGRFDCYLHTKARHPMAVYFLVYTVVFSLFLFLAFFEFARTGTSFIFKGDGVSQYFPKIVYFSRYIRKLFAGLLAGRFELPMYDFTSGLGAEVNYSMEPLYFLFALFPEKYLEFAYNLITVLRFYLAGVSFSILCFYFKKDYFPTFIGSAVYVISGFPLYGGTLHTMFMIPMIMLPLLIISIEEILKKRRWYLCTILVTISLFSNYYYLYMNLIAMGVYFLVRFFCRREGRTFKNFLTAGLTICGSCLLAAALGSIAVVTNFGVYLGSGRSGSALIKTPSLLFYRVDWLLSCFLTFLTTTNSPGEWLKLGFLPVALIALVVLFMRKGRKELKKLAVICMFFMAFPVFGFIFSGFSAVINRWCYIAALVVAYVVAECFGDLLRMEKREMAVCSAVIVVYGFLAFFGNYKSTLSVQVAFLFLAIMFVVLLISQEECRVLSRIMKKSLIVCLTAVLVFWQGFSMFHFGEQIDEFVKGGGEALRSVVQTPLAAVDEVGDDEGFYRCAMPKLSYYTSNASWLLGYHGVTMISSTYNGNIMEYLEKMGSTSYSPTQMLGLNNSAYMNNLAAVKYYAAFADPGRTLPYGTKEVLKTDLPYGEATVYENKYALPLGYTLKDVITEEELEDYNCVERQEVLMQKVLLNDSDGAAGAGEKGADAEITVQELEIESVDESRAYLTKHSLFSGMEDEVSEIRNKNRKNGKKKKIVPEEDDETFNLTLNFEGTPNSETYLVLENAFMKGDMSEEVLSISAKTEGNGLEYSFSPDDYRYKTEQEDFVFNLGYHEEAITSCELSFSREGRIRFDDLKLYSLPMDNMETYTEELTRYTLDDVSVDTNRVSGKISLDEDRILVISLPYQNGWTALVDGKETRLQRADYMYMALPLEAGDHTVELTYAIPGIRYAFRLTGGSACLFLVLVTAGFVRKRRKGRSAGGSGNQADAGGAR